MQSQTLSGNSFTDSDRWGLFTRALTLASSTVRVSVINTSANFMLTAVLGWIIFHESLPGECEQDRG